MDTSLDTKSSKSVKKQKRKQKQNSSVINNINKEKYDRTNLPLITEFNFLNPFVNPLRISDPDPRTYIFALLISSIQIYADICRDSELWDTEYSEDKEQIKKNKKALTKVENKIKAILKGLIPSVDTRKKEDLFLRLCRRSPELLVRHVELMVKAMGSYLDPSYKKKMWKKNEDVGKFYSDLTNKPFKKGLEDKINFKSKWTIALSIIAYEVVCDYRKLVDIYYEVPKRRRKELADTV